MTLEVPLLTSLKWFKSYLHNRVQIHRIKSDTKSITRDIPQGSIIGPLIFIISISDLVQISEVLFNNSVCR